MVAIEIRKLSEVPMESEMANISFAKRGFGYEIKRPRFKIYSRAFRA